MRALQGQVVAGRIEVPGEQLVDGASVTVLVDDDTPVRLSDDDILELKAAQAEIRAGEYVTVDELFTLLRKKAPK